MILINAQIIEEIINHFGRTGAKQRSRLRKFHAELLLSKFNNGERVLNAKDFNRPVEYINRIVKFSKGYLEYIDEENCEIKITDTFFLRMEAWYKQYSDVEELDHSDENLLEQGIIIEDDKITFDGRLSYSRFYKVISDEGESMNDPEDWAFNDKNIQSYSQIDFSDKNSPMFGSRLFLLKFYVLRKIDEVAFVTSRFVHCPACGANYVVPAAKIEFMQTYKCEKVVGDKTCGTTLKKFPARKMIPTYIYEIGVEVKNKDGTEFKEFFLESFREITPGYYTGMCFGRTEQKTNSFYFTSLTAREEKGRHEFEFVKHSSEHKFFDLVESVQKHVQKVGFIIDTEKAQLPIMIETLKKITISLNKEINLDHSLYFGAPGIGKTYALTMLHHLFYSNSGFISGPRFSLPGLTGGQKEIYYQDMAKKKNVPGLFSNQAFMFDEINNAQFLGDDKATNLFKSVALASSGTSSTVGGKEFPRTALIAATANYDIDHLKHYENKIRKIYTSEVKTDGTKEQDSFLLMAENRIQEIPIDFDYYKPLREYGVEVPKALLTAILKVRDEGQNYLTDFPKPLMERFYFSVLVHPKYDRSYLKQKKIDVGGHLSSRKSKYGQRELFSQLFVPNLDKLIFADCEETVKKFNVPEIEKAWSSQVEEYLELIANKHAEFFSMFHRINQVHVFILYALSVLNNETSLSMETRRVYERIVSLLHTPIQMNDFHKPDFDNYKYYGETKANLLYIIKKYPKRDMREFVDFNRPYARRLLVELENDRKIIKVSDFCFELDTSQKFEVIENDN